MFRSWGLMANMENEPTRTGKRLEGLAVEDLEGEQASVTSKKTGLPMPPRRCG